MIQLKRICGMALLAAVLAACADTAGGSSATTLPTQPSPDLPPSLSRIAAPATPLGSPSLVPASSPAFLTPIALASCPVTLPNGKAPSDPSAADFNYGNATGTLFTILWLGGKVVFSPHGPGQKDPDGSLEIKWPWYRTIPGDVVITGHRLDAPAPPMPTITLRGVSDGYEKTGFHPSEVLFPSAGCWEVTAKVDEASLTFVTLAVMVPFDPPWPGWLPEGLLLKDRDITHLPQSIRLIFGSPTGAGEVSIETSQGVQETPTPAPDATQAVRVKGQPGECAQGGWDGQGRWNAEADTGTLKWVSNGFSYRISHTGLGLRCAELLRIAESLCFDPTVLCEAAFNDGRSGYVELPEVIEAIKA
jgi:hypothetical protein